MKALHFSLASVVCGLIACGNSTDAWSDPSSSEILATVPVGSYGAGSAELLTTIRFSLSMRATGPDTGLATHYALFDQVPIRDGDEGATLIATADNDPDFTGFAARLTDGVDEPITTGVGGASSTTNESRFFLPKPSTGADFAGYTIDSIEFRIDSVLITTPGRNPNGNGFWTDYDLGGRVVVLGHHN